MHSARRSPEQAPSTGQRWVLGKGAAPAGLRNGQVRGALQGRWGGQGTLEEMGSSECGGRSILKEMVLEKKCPGNRGCILS